MLNARLIVVLAVAHLAACTTTHRPQAASPQPIVSNDLEEPEYEETKYDNPLDLLELLVLDPPANCTLEVIHSYDSMVGLWVYMHPDRQQKNRFYGAVLTSNFAPGFKVGARCPNNVYQEYNGPIEVWRRTVHEPWKQMDMGPLYRGSVPN